MTVRKDFPELRPPCPAELADEVRAMLAGAAAKPPIWQGSAQQARAEQQAIAARRAPGPAVAMVRDELIDGPAGPLPVRIYRPDRPIAAICYFHGGGWVMGSIADSDAHVRRVVQATNATIVSVDYRLAPEAPFPAAIDDAVAAWRWALGNRHALAPDGAPLGIAGESAGGNVAAGAAIALRDLGLPMPAFQMLGYPVTSAAMESPSYHDQAEGPVLSAADMRWFWDQYAPDPASRADPRAAPLDRADLSGLPPTFVMTAECDPLRDEGEAYAERLRMAGSEAEYCRYPGMVHGFYKMADMLAGGREALADAAAFVRRQAAAMPNRHSFDAKSALD